MIIDNLIILIINNNIISNNIEINIKYYIIGFIMCGIYNRIIKYI